MQKPLACAMILAEVKRMNREVVEHYDLLVEEGNDPVHDPDILRDYMDLWDGQGFLDRMGLDTAKTVLEIGVGTGRLAVRVAPLCGAFWGIDLSPKTIERAGENLSEFGNVRLCRGDFLTHEFAEAFDVVYSSLTFMHIKDKQEALRRIEGLLRPGGRLVLSIDKNRSDVIDTGTRKVRIYPDDPEEISAFIGNAGLRLTERYETEFAHIFVAEKK